MSPARLLKQSAPAAAGVFVCLAPALAGGASWATAAAKTAPVPHQPARVCSATHQDERAFLAENDKAMGKMMAGMSIKPTGDVDRDFVDMMVPHHQGAIDMAVAVLRYGRNPIVRRLAQEIIVDQQQEIAAMRRAVGEPLPPSAPAPTTAPPATPDSPAAMPGMDMN
jgi:hypothetical protein